MPTVRLWRVLTPELLREKEMRLELLNALRRMGTKVKRDFQETTKTWNHKPDFGPAEPSLRGGKAMVEVSTDDNQYRWVNDGTKPHGIASNSGKRLAFPSEFTPKTMPGVIGSETGYHGGDVIQVYQVWHPGNEARKFDKAIAAKWRKDFRKEMDDTMAKVRLASGNPL